MAREVLPQMVEETEKSARTKQLRLSLDLTGGWGASASGGRGNINLTSVVSPLPADNTAVTQTDCPRLWDLSRLPKPSNAAKNQIRMWDKQPESRPPAKIRAEMNSQKVSSKPHSLRQMQGRKKDPWRVCGIFVWETICGASLVAQMVKNPPTMREIQIWSLCWEDPLEEGMTTHSSIFAWRISMDRGAW